MIENGLGDVGKTIFRNATKMALEFIVPDCCQDCTGQKNAVGNLADFAIKTGQAVRVSVDQFHE